MSTREKVEELIRWELTANPLAQKIALWREDDPPVETTLEERQRAFEAYVSALNKAILLLADELDRIEISPAEP